MRVWEAKLDNIYNCFVERTGDYAGKLKIEKDNTIVFEKDVSMMYNAIFGPDIADVNDWEQTCIDYVDGLNT